MRGDREVQVRLWYPTDVAADPAGPGYTEDAEPAIDDQPWPLIVSSTKVAAIFAPIVVRHGFAWAGVDRLDTYMTASAEMVDQPLDLLFALEIVATSPPAELAGRIDATRAGVTGYSFDGYNAYALSGARVDPAHYLAQCPTPDAEMAPFTVLSAFGCGPADDWPAFAERAGSVSVTGDDGLWMPMTDARIRAVMPMAGEGAWLFGARGLEAVDRPMLVVTATGDSMYAENAWMFDHLGIDDKAFISFVGPGHVAMVADPALTRRLAHFVAAFFGHRLQGRDDLAALYGPKFVAQHPDLAWGVVGAGDR